jgi:hypothetical protein
MKLYTIGFSGKNAATFFGLLRRSPPSAESGVAILQLG